MNIFAMRARWPLPGERWPAVRPPERALALAWAISRMHLAARRLDRLRPESQAGQRVKLLGEVCEEVLLRHGFSKVVSGRPPEGPALMVANHRRCARLLHRLRLRAAGRLRLILHP
ncbi:MAG: hypothetical protein U1E65_03390 [Myxococcota bacterium]